MPLTEDWAKRLLQISFAGTPALPTYSATKVSLCTSATVPNATTAGTPISGDPRVGPASWTTPATVNGVTAIANVDAFSFTNMPAVAAPGVRYYDIYDSAGSPNRKAYGQLAADRVTVSGDTLTVSAGALSVGLVTSVQATPST